MVELISKFKPMYSNEYRYCILTGGRGSSKSFHVSDFLLKLTYEVGHVILFTRYTMTSAHLSIIPEFVEKIDLYNLHGVFDVTKTEIINKRTGSKIIFRGIKTSSGNQTASLKSIQGVTTFVLDEAEELDSEDIFDKINESVRKKDITNRVIVILNPTTKEHWIYKRFFESRGIAEGSNTKTEDTVYIHTTYLDNIKNLSKSFIDNFERLKQTNILKYNHRVLGGWLSKSDGVVFENWRIDNFVDCGQIIFGQDYGYFPDPTTLVKCSVDKKNKRIYIKECFVETGKSTEQIAELNRRYCGRNLIVADNAEPRLINDIKAKGINIIPCTKGAGSIVAGINLLLEYELIIDPESLNVIKELNNYTYSDKKSQLTIDDYNHTIDSFRYCVSYYLKNQSQKGLRQLN